MMKPIIDKPFAIGHAVRACFLFASLAFSITALAQHDHGGQQPKKIDSTTAVQTNATENSKKQLAQLLASYYNVKNALVAGDATSAANNAEEFLRTANTVDYKVISEGNIHTLAIDAGRISETRDLKRQREYFANFSINMAEVARAIKLSQQPIYLQYCPMKKASWLSSEKAIKNPYYGSSMLSCGQVTETF